MGGGKKSTASTTPAISSLALQSAGFGAPIQICYGTNRVSPMLVWTNGFHATAHQDNSQQGGKGGGSSGGGQTTYTYNTNIVMLVCEGEIRDFGKEWRNKDTFTALQGFSYTTKGILTQPIWGFLTTYYPTEALAYAGSVLVGSAGYALGDSADLGNHSFEIFGIALSAVETEQNYRDAYIKDVITDFISHPRYGVISLQTANLRLDMTKMHSYCAARGLLISPLLSEQRPAYEWLLEWAMIANTGIVWSEGILKFIPYSDEPFSNTFATYLPDTTIRYHFDDDNITEAIAPKRKKLIDCFNKVTVECLDRSHDYNKYTQDAKDQAAIEQFGLRTAQTLVLNSICLPSVAVIVAHTQLLRELYIRNDYTIMTWCDADLLEPMDFITLSDMSLGLDSIRCRITAIDDDQEGHLTITVEEAPQGVYCG